MATSMRTVVETDKGTQCAGESATSGLGKKRPPWGTGAGEETWALSATADVWVSAGIPNSEAPHLPGGDRMVVPFRAAVSLLL